MRWVRWATYLWPGLPQLWFDGAWSGLALAIGFSCLLNLLLVASLVWVQLVEPAVLGWGWMALASAWVVSIVVMGWGSKSHGGTVHTAAQEDLFRRALAEYLRGAWFEAESLWVQIVAGHSRDVDARLMLATLLRRRKRYPEALAQIAELERIEASARWQTEIEREKELLAELCNETLAREAQLAGEPPETASEDESALGAAKAA